MKEDTTQVKVVVPIKDLWKAMSSDMRHIVPKVLPNIVKEVELLEGDGGLGSILLFKFCPGAPKLSSQKEKIAELDESLHQISLEIVEGGHLDQGFCSYMTRFKLTAVAETETLIDIKLLYETKADHIHIPGQTLKATLQYIKCFENHLLNNLS